MLRSSRTKSESGDGAPTRNENSEYGPRQTLRLSTRGAIKGRLIPSHVGLRKWSFPLMLLLLMMTLNRFFDLDNDNRGTQIRKEGHHRVAYFRGGGSILQRSRGGLPRPNRPIHPPSVDLDLRRQQAIDFNVENLWTDEDIRWERRKARERIGENKRLAKLMEKYREMKTFENRLEDDLYSQPKDDECHYRPGLDAKYRDDEEPWQSTFNPVCNSLHEIISNPGEVTYLAAGSQSMVFALQENGFQRRRDQLVWKTQRYSGRYVEGYTGDSLRKREIDAKVMDELTASPYILSIWGYCGMSTLSPVAREGTLFDAINGLRSSGPFPRSYINYYETSITHKIKLRIAYQVAQGLADLHSIGQMNHLDLDVSQHVLINGVFQLNDLGYGKLWKWTDNGVCKDTSWPIEAASYKSPEELNSIIYTGERIRLDKSDVFSLGNELFVILTGTILFEGDNKRNCDRLMEGGRSNFPQWVLQSEAPAVKAMLKAIRLCWRQNPESRPSAKEIASLLRESLVELGEIDSDQPLVRASIPKLPEHYTSYDDAYCHDAHGAYAYNI